MSGIKPNNAMIVSRFLTEESDKAGREGIEHRKHAYANASISIRNLSDEDLEKVITPDSKGNYTKEVKYVKDKIRALINDFLSDPDQVDKIRKLVIIETSKKYPNLGNNHKNYIPRAEFEMKLLPIVMGLDELNLKHEVVGSFRRGKELVGDGDIIIVGEMPNYEFFSSLGKVTSYGKKKAKLVTKDLEFDFRTCTEEELPFMQLYFTGSAAFNQWMRAIAKARGFKLNEYGLFNMDGTRVLNVFRTEKDIFDYLGIPYVEPSKRY